MTERTSYINETLKKYLEDLSARTDVPGGGSAAALSAAIAVALNLMVINFSLQKDSGIAESDMMIVAKAKQEEALKKLSLLVDKDSKVFRSLMEAISKKEPDLEDKYVAAAKVPLDVCSECHAALDIAAFLSDSGNRNLISDVGCAARLLRAAFDSARYNVEINLRSIKDEETVKVMKSRIDGLAEGIKSAEEEIARNVEKVLTGKAG